MGRPHLHGFRFWGARERSVGDGEFTVAAILHRGRVVSGFWGKYFRRAVTIRFGGVGNNPVGLPPCLANNGQPIGRILRKFDSGFVSAVSSLCPAKPLLRAEHARELLADLDFL